MSYNSRHWTATLGVSLAAFFAFPSLRVPLSAILALHAGIFSMGIADLRLQFFGPALYRKKGETSRCALTFDDGPDKELTPAVLDLLARYNMKATFFVIGDRVHDGAGILHRIRHEGHTIGCHDLSHRWTSNFRLTKSMILDISESLHRIEDCTGVSPRLYRPPVGLSNPHLAGALKTLDLYCTGWSRSARDAGNRRIKSINRISNLAGPGDVILLHDCLPVKDYRESFLDNLESLLRNMKTRDLYSVTVDRLFGIPAYSSK